MESPAAPDGMLSKRQSEQGDVDRAVRALFEIDFDQVRHAKLGPDIPGAHAGQGAEPLCHDPAVADDHRRLV